MFIPNNDGKLDAWLNVLIAYAAEHQTALNLSDDAFMGMNTAIKGWQDKLAIFRRARHDLRVEGLSLGTKLREIADGWDKELLAQHPILAALLRAHCGTTDIPKPEATVLAERHRTHLLTFADGGGLPPGVAGCHISALISGSAPAGTVDTWQKMGVAFRSPHRLHYEEKHIGKTVAYTLSWIMPGGDVGPSGPHLEAEILP